MGFIAKTNKKNGDFAGTTIISAGTKINGTFNIECNLHIYDRFEGVINSKSLVVIGKEGTVRGKVNAKEVIISGLFFGDVECQKIEILSGGTVEGSIVADEMIVERGGFIIGESSLLSKRDLRKDMHTKKIELQ